MLSYKMSKITLFKYISEKDNCDFRKVCLIAESLLLGNNLDCINIMFKPTESELWAGILLKNKLEALGVSY
jgi:hypothetical protein